MGQETLNQIETFIQSGNSKSAQLMILDFIKKNPRPEPQILLQVAHQSRRSGLPMYSIKLLRPWIFFDQELRLESPPEFRSAYAAGLISLGAVPEGLRILSNVDSKDSPDSLFFSTLAFFQSWNYRKALSFLRKYLQSNKITEYQSLVGKVNMIAAFLSLDQFEEAEQLIESCLHEVNKYRLRLLQGNVMELKAQSLFLQKRYQEAKVFLNNSKSILESAGGFYYIYAKKWDLLTQLYDLPKEKRSPKGFDELRKLAFDRGNFETLRDLDLHEGLLFNKEYLLNKVYFGTPYKTYRLRLLKQFPDKFELNKQFLLNESENPEIILDRQGPLVVKGRLSIPTVPASVALAFQILTSDIYKPVRLASFFSEFYKNEHFHPHTSPQRVLKVIRRLNLWFQSNHLPMTIISSNSSFHFKMEKNIGLLISKKTQFLSKNAIAWKKLFHDYGFHPFSIHQTTVIWPTLTLRQRQRLLQIAIQEKVLKVQGKGKSIRYVFSK